MLVDYKTPGPSKPPSATPSTGRDTFPGEVSKAEAFPGEEPAAYSSLAKSGASMELGDPLASSQGDGEPTQLVPDLKTHMPMSLARQDFTIMLQVLPGYAVYTVIVFNYIVAIGACLIAFLLRHDHVIDRDIYLYALIPLLGLAYLFVSCLFMYQLFCQCCCCRNKLSREQVWIIFTLLVGCVCLGVAVYLELALDGDSTMDRTWIALPTIVTDDFIKLLWLLLMDSFALVDTPGCRFYLPKLGFFLANVGSVMLARGLAGSGDYEKLNAYVSVGFYGMWIVWMLCITFRTRAALKSLTELTHRTRQLEFGFFYWQSGVVIVAQAVILVSDAVYGIVSRTALMFLLQVYMFLLAYVYLPAPHTKGGTQEEGTEKAPLNARGSKQRCDFTECCAAFQAAFEAYDQQPFEGQSTAWDEEWPLQVHRNTEVLGTVQHEDSDTQCVVLDCLAQGYIVVAFRGTVSSKNVKTDINMRRIALQSFDHTEQGHDNASARFSSTMLAGKGAKVHAGFWLAYSSVREQVWDLVQARLAKPGSTAQQSSGPASWYGSKSPRVLCTGHSLGGALANLAALDLKERLGAQVGAVSCISFGSPRVGNVAWAELCNQHLEALRIVNNKDIITASPHWLFFEHAGHEAVLLDTKGSYMMDPSFVESTFLESRLSIQDHEMVSYHAGLVGLAIALEKEHSATRWYDLRGKVPQAV